MKRRTYAPTGLEHAVTPASAGQFREQDAAHAAYFAAKLDEETHETTIVQRPFDQVRPICTCGWLGTTCRNVADAEIEAADHESNA